MSIGKHAASKNLFAKRLSERISEKPSLPIDLHAIFFDAKLNDARPTVWEVVCWLVKEKPEYFIVPDRRLDPPSKVSGRNRCQATSIGLSL